MHRTMCSLMKNENRIPTFYQFFNLSKCFDKKTIKVSIRPLEITCWKFKKYLTGETLIRNLRNVSGLEIKFIYPEEATKSYKIFPLLWTVCTWSKVRGRFRKILWPSQNIWSLLNKFQIKDLSKLFLWILTKKTA